MSNDLLTLINRLSTAVLLVVLMIACQQMPDSQTRDGTPSEYQAN